MSDAVAKYYQSFSTPNNDPLVYQNTLNEFSEYNYSQNNSHYYNLEGSSTIQTKKFSCKVCNKDFFTYGMYKKHIDNHENCPFPECNYKASLKAIDTHITHQHMLINFNDLQIDDKAWVAERKKRFPSLQRAESRRDQQIERLKRGERLGKDNRKFPKHKSTVMNQRSSTSSYYSSNKSTKNSSFSKSSKQFCQKSFSKIDKTEPVYISNDSDDSDCDIKQGIHRFKGINALLESTGEISMFRLNHLEKTEECDKEILISDEEDWSTPTSNSDPSQNSTLNPLGSLLGAYYSDSENDDSKETPMEVISQSLEQHGNNNANTIKSSTEFSQTKGECEDFKTSTSKTRRRSRIHGKDLHNKNLKRMNDVIRKRPFKRRRPTLLEKLLQPEIIHERNVILQCIRYIVQNDFFDSDK